jgi:hypothetical protein
MRSRLIPSFVSGLAFAVLVSFAALQLLAVGLLVRAMTDAVAVIRYLSDVAIISRRFPVCPRLMKFRIPSVLFLKRSARVRSALRIYLESSTTSCGR